MSELFSAQDREIFLALIREVLAKNPQFYSDEIDRRTDALLSDLEKFLRLLLEANKHTNLTAIREPQEAIFKHLYDALLLLHFEPLHTVLDFGTGGGVPGIPLALFRKHFSAPEPVWFLDSVKKKLVLVESFARSLGISQCSFFPERGESFIVKNAPHSVVMRAVAPPERSIPWLSNKVKRWVFMTGPTQLVDWLNSEAALKKKGLTIYSKQSFSLPSALGERHILEVRPL